MSLMQDCQIGTKTLTFQNQVFDMLGMKYHKLGNKEE